MHIFPNPTLLYIAYLTFFIHIVLTKNFHFYKYLAEGYNVKDFSVERSFYKGVQHR